MMSKNKKRKGEKFYDGHYIPLRGKELGKKIVAKYQNIGITLKIISSYVIGCNERFVFKVRLNHPRQIQKFLQSAEAVRYSFKRPFSQFYALKESDGLFLMVSEMPASKVDLWNAFATYSFQVSTKQMELPIVIGRNMRGEIIVKDLAKLIHILVGGTTGSGKSVFLRSLVCSILVFRSPDEVNFVLFDTGSNDLSLFDGVCHLSYPVIQDSATATRIILSLQAEMNRRYREKGDYPFLVCIVDEASALVSNLEDKATQSTVCDALSDLLRRGRKAKIIWVLAAQDPTKENMKIELANITTRIAFRCAKCQNSITILDAAGAEDLEGNGDMLLKCLGTSTPMRLQGAYPETENIERTVFMLSRPEADFPGKFMIPQSYLTSSSESKYSKEVVPVNPMPLSKNPKEKVLCHAILWALKQENVSVKRYSDDFHVGNNTASLIVDNLSKLGIVSEQFAKQPRQVLIRRIEDLPEEANALLLRNGFQVSTVNGEQQLEEDSYE